MSYTQFTHALEQNIHASNVVPVIFRFNNQSVITHKKRKNTQAISARAKMLISEGMIQTDIMNLLSQFNQATCSIPLSFWEKKKEYLRQLTSVVNGVTASMQCVCLVA